MTVSLILNDLDPFEVDKFAFLHEMIHSLVEEHNGYYIESILYFIEMCDIPLDTVLKQSKNSGYPRTESLEKKFKDAHNLIYEIYKELSKIN